MISGEITAHTTLESGDTTRKPERTGCTTTRHLLLTRITGLSLTVSGYAMMLEAITNCRREISGKSTCAKMQTVVTELLISGLYEDIYCFFAAYGLCLKQNLVGHQ